MSGFSTKMPNFNVYSNSGVLIRPVLDTTASPADYFAGCLFIYGDLMQGGEDLNNIFKSSGLGGNSKDDIVVKELAPKSALVMFISTLHEHEFFSPDAIFNEKHPCFPAVRGIAFLLESKLDDLSVPIEFWKVLKLFNIPGIGKIENTFLMKELKRLASTYKLEDKMGAIQKEDPIIIAQILRRAVFEGNVADVQFIVQNFVFLVEIHNCYGCLAKAEYLIQTYFTWMTTSKVVLCVFNVMFRFKSYWLY